MIWTALALLISYLLGSIPTGLWLGLRLRKIDIREHGSKNIGATNTMRTLGKGLGAVALVGDMAKGYVSVVAIALLSEWEYAPIVRGLAAIAGHTWSLFLKFRGGKGVATSAGVFFGLAAIPMGIALVVFLMVIGVTRMVSAGSILAAVALAVSVFLFSDDLVLRIIATCVALLVIVRHRDNIRRILAGPENRN